MTLRSLPRRMLRAVLLDAQVYEEVERDKRSLAQATLVVLLACAAGVLGVWLRDVVLGGRSAGDGQVRLALAIDLIEPLVLWLGGSLFAYMIGVSFFRGPHTQSDYLEVLRTTGFAFTPGLLRALAFVPPAGLGFGVAVAGDVWMLACGVVAVRQALDFTTLRALGTFGLAYALLWLALTGLLAWS